MKRKTETPAYRPPNAAELTEEQRRKRVRNRVHEKKVVEEKQTKLIVNLNRCSQNWKSIIPNLPTKVAFKRQQLTKSKHVEKKPAELVEAPADLKVWFDVDKVNV